MKTLSFIKAIAIVSAVALIVTSCKKETNSPNPATVAAIQGMRIAYNNTKTQNDSLNYWYNMDSVHNIGMIYHCDSLYHYCNSIMMNNYNTMNSEGGMMNGSSTSGGMMGGGSSNGNMMGGNGTTIDCSINGNNSTTMINSLHQQHIHHPTH